MSKVLACIVDFMSFHKSALNGRVDSVLPPKSTITMCLLPLELCSIWELQPERRDGAQKECNSYLRARYVLNLK